MIDQIDDILFYLRDSDSKKPMAAETLAAKLEVSMKRFEEMMNIICDIVPAPVNRAYREVPENIEKNIKGFKGYVYWPTGVIDKAHWKDFKPASSKPAALPPIRTENSIPKVSADTYETPVFGQTHAVETAVAEIEKIIDAQTDKGTAYAVHDYSGKSKAYQILKFIEANPAATTKLLSDLVGTADIGNYVKSYSERGLVVCGKNEHGKRTWSLKDGWTAEQVYDTRKGGANYSELPVKPLPLAQQAPLEKQPGAPKNETTPTAVHAQEMQSTEQVKSDSADETIKDKSENHAPIKAENDQVSQGKVRFAITSDKHIILMGLTPDDIELTEGDSNTLIQFCGDIALAANVSSVLASKVIDLETLGS